MNIVTNREPRQPKDCQEDELNMTKILFAVRPQLLRDALCRQLAAQPDLQVVGDVDNDLDLLLAVRATEAEVVVHSWQGDRMPALYTHLLQEYPGLTVIGLTEEGELRHCQQRIVETRLADGIESLVATLSHSGRRQKISA
jgi:hypothetical protein